MMRGHDIYLAYFKIKHIYNSEQYNLSKAKTITKSK